MKRILCATLSAILITSMAWAVDTKVSDLTPLSTTPTGTDEIYINDGGVSKKITYTNLMSGTASTATALAADPTDCSANQFATTIAANGNLTCAAIADADVPDDITITIPSNGVNGTNLALGSDVAGDVMYYNGTDYVRLGIGTADQLLRVNSGATAPEYYTNKKTMNIVLESPADTDSFLMYKAPQAITITHIECIVDPADTGESAVIDVQECNSNGDSCLTVDNTITCDNDGAADDGTFSNGTIDSGDWINFDIVTVTGTITAVSVTTTYAVD